LSKRDAAFTARAAMAPSSERNAARIASASRSARPGGTTQPSLLSATVKAASASGSDTSTTGRPTARRL